MLHGIPGVCWVGVVKRDGYRSLLGDSPGTTNLVPQPFDTGRNWAISRFAGP
jgi:hypothetical protein